jgi:hypothetical protein
MHAARFVRMQATIGLAANLLDSDGRVVSPVANMPPAVFTPLERTHVDFFVAYFSKDFGNHRSAIDMGLANGYRAVFAFEQLNLVKDQFTAGFGFGHAVNPELFTLAESQAAGTVTNYGVHQSLRWANSASSDIGARKGPDIL